jgi:hypothetical protein
MKGTEIMKSRELKKKKSRINKGKQMPGEWKKDKENSVTNGRN